jgi:predicted  nucleic acid-binding Zn-ribbon protein
MKMLKITGFKFVCCMALVSAMQACNSADQKVENSKEDLSEAKQEAREERRESIADYDVYKAEVEQKIAANEVKIAELRKDMLKRKANERGAYKEKIDALEQKNNDLRKKIGDYDKTNTEKWEEFKSELNHDLDGIGESLRDLGRDNK